MAIITKAKIQLRHGTLAEFQNNNPALEDGEVAVVTSGEERGRSKTGPGNFASLPFDDQKVVDTAASALAAANAAQATADGKAPFSHASYNEDAGSGSDSVYGHIRLNSTTLPLMDGDKASAGKEGKAADIGHVHPVDTSRAPASAMLEAETHSGTDMETNAVAPFKLQTLFQLIWNKIRSLVNNINGLKNNTVAGIAIQDNPTTAQIKANMELNNVQNVNQRDATNITAGTLAEGRLPSLTIEESDTSTDAGTALKTGTIKSLIQWLRQGLNYIKKYYVINTRTINDKPLSANITLVKGDVGLGNVDNVQQATKANFDSHVDNTTAHITGAERTAWNAKQNKLSRTVAVNDNSSEADITDIGDSLSIPVPVEVAAPSASTTQATKGTKTLRAIIQTIVNNLAWILGSSGLESKAPLESPTFTTPKTTPNTNYSTQQLRNIYCGTTDMTAGSSSLDNGVIYIVYE